MEEYSEHLRIFADKGMQSLTGSRMPVKEWGNKRIAEDYLRKYWLPTNEYQREWKRIQDAIFTNQECGVPQIQFQAGFRIYPLRGGIVFDQEYFEKLRACIEETHDTSFVLVQNLCGKSTAGKLRPFMMKYPVDISWKEVMSGNYISSVLFEWSANEYFIFGDSCKWGEYIASDYVHPLNILIFREEYGNIFRGIFKVSREEWIEILENWLPPEYEKYL